MRLTQFLVLATAAGLAFTSLGCEQYRVSPVAEAEAQPAPSPIATPSPDPNPPIALSQSENDFLFDLSQTVQPAEFDRTTQSEKLAVGRQIAGWAKAGEAKYREDVETKFDETFRSVVVGDYGLNRAGYIAAAVKRLAPGFEAVLQPKPIVQVQVVQQSARLEAVSSRPSATSKFNAVTASTSGDRVNCRATPNGNIVRTFGQGRLSLGTESDGWYLENFNNCWVHHSQIRFISAGLSEAIENEIQYSSGLPRSFANCTEARAAGYSNFSVSLGSSLDQDNDGIACES